MSGLLGKTATVGFAVGMVCPIRSATLPIHRRRHLVGLPWIDRYNLRRRRLGGLSRVQR
jgi:hypothetical protein